MLAAAMSVAVTMPVESVNAEAAIGYATAHCDETPVRAARDFTQQAGTAIAPPHKPHRYRADRRATHHGQKDAARAFHGAVSGWIFKGRVEFGAGNLSRRAAARQVKRGCFATWCGAHDQSPVSHRRKMRARFRDQAETRV
jgi:hypothetical protein